MAFLSSGAEGGTAEGMFARVVGARDLGCIKCAHRGVDAVGGRGCLGMPFEDIDGHESKGLELPTLGLF